MRSLALTIGVRLAGHVSDSGGEWPPVPDPEWVLAGGAGRFTIIESPIIAPPVVVGGEGKFTITG